MQAIPTSLKSSSQSRTLVAAALLFVLTFGLFGAAAKAQAPVSAFQNIVLNQATLLGAVAMGGGESGQAPAGDTMGVNSFGNVFMGNTYGSQVLMFSPQSTTATILGAPGANPAGTAVDTQNNLYVALSTSTVVLKVPFVNGAYATLSAPSGSTPNCTGNDTAECAMNNLTTNGSGVISLAFDAKGDLFYSTSNTSQITGTTPNSIWEITAAGLYAGTPAAKLLFTEPTSATPNTTGQLNIGGLALDPFGDLFFTDSAVGVTNSQESFSSNLNELVFTSGTGYATTPTVLYTHIPATPGNFDDEINGVVTDASGTVYTLIQNTGGILAFPNANGVINTSKMYLASTLNGKLLATDGQGNFYMEGFNNGVGGDAVSLIGIDNLVAPTSAIGTASTATFTVILNDGSCTPAPMVAFAASTTGTTTSPFSAVTTGTCASTFTGDASYSATLSFTPAVVGTATTTLTASDTNGNMGTATTSGVGAGTVATPAFSPIAGTYTGTQMITVTDATLGASIYYTTDGSMPGMNTGTSTLYSAPISVAASETVNAIAVDAGDTSSMVATAVYSINVAGAAATPTLSPAAGTYTAPQVVTIADTTAGAAIYYTTDGSTPAAGTGTSVLYTTPIIVSSTETLNAVAVISGMSNSAAATALYTINLPPSAFQNVLVNQSTQFGTLPSGGAQSGESPAGDTMAVNSAGNVLVGNTYGGQITLYTPQGVQTVLGSPSGNVSGVAVDGQNNLFIGLGYSSTLVKVPYVNGAYATITTEGSTTPACTGTDTAECVVSSVTAGGTDIISMVFDSKGDLFYSTTNSAGGGNSQNSIFKCSAACLYATGGSPAPVLLFQEPVASAPNTSGQLSIGGLALDASGDIFFTDSAIGTANNQESFSSDLDELAVTSSTNTGYAAAPTVIYTYTPTSNASFGAELDGVSVAPNGTVYAATEGLAGGQTGPATGIFAFPLGTSGYSNSTMYVASTQNGKLMTGDYLGNLYIVDDNENVFEITLDNITAPTAAVTNPATATNLTTILNDGGCGTTPPTVAFAFTGTSASDFTAATTGSCTAFSTNVASFATTLTFTPTVVGANSATLTATDSLSNKGTALVSGTGTPAPPAATPTFTVAAGTYTTVQMVGITDTSTNALIYYTTDGSTPSASSTPYTTPITIGATETINAIATGGGFAISPVATALYTINLPTVAIPTFSVAAGTYTTVQTVSLADATTGAMIYYTIDGSTPAPGVGTSILYSAPITVAASTTINAIAVAAGSNNSAVATAAYVINLPPDAFTITTSIAGATITTTGGTGSATIMLAANAAFNGPISFTCSGFLPVGATCTFAPSSVTLAALASGTTTLTVTVPKTSAALHRGPGPLVPTTMLAVALCLLGLRKRSRLQVMLLFVVSVVGLSMFSGCTTTSSSFTSSSQFIVTGTGSSCPVTDLTCATNSQSGGPKPTQVVENLPMILTVP
jgi:hypothetical protein